MGGKKGEEERGTAMSRPGLEKALRATLRYSSSVSGFAKGARFFFSRVKKKERGKID